MNPHEYVVHAEQLRTTLPPVAEALALLAVVGLAWAWVLAAAWAARH